MQPMLIKDGKAQSELVFLGIIQTDHKFLYIRRSASSPPKL